MQAQSNLYSIVFVLYEKINSISSKCNAFKCFSIDTVSIKTIDCFNIIAINNNEIAFSDMQTGLHLCI